MSLELLEVQLLQKLKVRMMSRKEKKMLCLFLRFYIFRCVFCTLNKDNKRMQRYIQMHFNESFLIFFILGCHLEYFL